MLSPTIAGAAFGHAAACSICRPPMRAPLRRRETLAADGLILDLEDAVAPDAKTAARSAAVAADPGKAYGPAKC